MITLKNKLGISLLTGGLAAALMVIGGIALAIHSNPNELHACYKNNNGQMRYVTDPADCLPSEIILTWNQQGLQGPQGPAGPAGELSNVTLAFADSAVADQTFAYAAAECPTGTLATGGGWAMQGTVGVGNNLDSFLVLSSVPYGTGQGWQASVRRSGPTGSGREWGVRVFAVCAS